MAKSKEDLYHKFHCQVLNPDARKWIQKMLKGAHKIPSLRAELIIQSSQQSPNSRTGESPNQNNPKQRSKRKNDKEGDEKESPERGKESSNNSSKKKKASSITSVSKDGGDIRNKLTQIGARKVVVGSGAKPARGSAQGAAGPPPGGGGGGGGGGGEGWTLKGPMACHQPVHLARSWAAPPMGAGGLRDPAAARPLWRRFQQDGYLLLRGLLPATAVAALRDKVQGALKRVGAAGADGLAVRGQPGRTVHAPIGDAILGTDLYVAPDLAERERRAWKKVGTGDEIQRCLRGPEVAALLAGFAACAAEDAAAAAAAAAKRKAVAAAATAYQPINMHPFYTWIRIKGAGEMTVEHADYFHFREATPLFASPSEVDDSMAQFLPARTAAEKERRREEGGGDAAEFGCRKCQDPRDTDKILLCDECDSGCHIDCLDPPLKSLPQEQWFCQDCNPRPVFGTVWMPLEPLPVEHGTFCILPKSHNITEYHEQYKDHQLPNNYWRESKGRPWHVAEYEPGDVVLFDMRTVHATTKNLTDRFRMSVDTRWCLQPQRANNGETPSTIFLEQIKDGSLNIDW